MRTPKEPRVEADADWGEKTIVVKVRFYTHDIAKGKNKIKPKHCWGAGVVAIAQNEAHGIKHNKRAYHFKTRMEISAAIEKALRANGIIMLPSWKEARQPK